MTIGELIRALGQENQEKMVYFCGPGWGTGWKWFEVLDLLHEDGAIKLIGRSREDDE